MGIVPQQSKTYGGEVRETYTRSASGHSNNFDLLRLLAAGQVAFLHLVANLEVPQTQLLALLRTGLVYFPGVPVFFVISGFLVSKSLERNPSLADYARNRVLRIYPALWMSTAVTLILITTLADFPQAANGGVPVTPTKSIMAWLAAQLTFAQFYSPAAVDDFYGVGHLNGSLWTIPVELQFYVALPLIYLALRNHNRGIFLGRLVALLAASYLLTIIWQATRVTVSTLSEDVALLLRVTLAPYLYMFTLGIILQRIYPRIRHLLDGYGAAWLGGYVVVTTVLESMWGLPIGSNTPSLPSMILLAVTVISLAHSAPSLSARILRGHDISYGLYIYHMVVANALWQVGLLGDYRALATGMILSVLAAGLSWLLVERPVLRIKTVARSVQGPATRLNA